MDDEKAFFEKYKHCAEPSALDFIWHAKLTNATKLYLGRKKVNDLSPLEDLGQLEQLSLHDTKVSDLTPLKKLSKLQRLYIDRTQVSDLTPLKDLKQLQQLSVSITQVSDLTPVVGLTKLRVFYASYTQVKDLTPLNGLMELSRLYVDNTLVENIIPLEDLVQLNLLDINSTNISDLNPLKKLKLLEHLSISNTQVSDLNPLKELKLLRSIRIESTKVRDLSPLKVLINLRQLRVDGNSIRSKENIEWLVNRPIFQELFISNSPALDNPLLLSKYDSDNVLTETKTYLKSLKEGTSNIIYEAKMILVGESEVGKTSVRKKLVIGNDKFKAIPQKGISTEGFEIDVYQTAIDFKGKQQNVTLNIWDLGGQDVQLPTHQFFMRHSALYLFVFNSRLNDEQNRFDKWLYLIQKLSNDPRNPGAVCPIVGVMNQFDKQTKLFTAETWLKEYKGQLKNFVTVNCSQLNDKGMSNLEKEIAQQLINIEGFGRIEMNDTWIAVRKELINITPQSKLISINEYKKICHQKGVEDANSQDVLLNLLDRLGSLLWYEEEVPHLSTYENYKLRSIVFLDHQWASQAIYQLLMDKKELINHEATMSFGDLKQYWIDKYWDNHEYLILMMKRFGFCFETLDKEHFILTPLLSQVRLNEADEFKIKLNKSNKKVLRLRLDYAEKNREDIMPRALTARLIAIKHKDIIKYTIDKRLYWRHGVALNNKRSESKALIEENVKQSIIDITVVGDKAREYLAELLATYNDLHDSLGGLKPQILIPCNCKVCLNNSDPHYFNKEEELEMRLTNGRNDIECKKPPFENVLIRPLISDLMDGDLQIALKGKYSLQELAYGNYEIEDKNVEPELSSISPPNVSVVVNVGNQTQSVGDMAFVQPTPSVLEIKKEETIIERLKNKNMNKTYIFLGSLAFIALIYFGNKMFNSPRPSEFEVGKDKVSIKVGEEKSTDKINDKITKTLTVIGKIKINGINANSEDVKRVSVKDNNLVSPVTLDDSRFKLENVPIPSDNLVTIEIELKNGLSKSALFNLPKPNENNVSDLKEVLIDVKKPSNSGASQSKAASPTIIINNQNIQGNNSK